MSLVVWAGLAGAGGVGAMARFLVDAAVSARVGRALALGTLAVNLTGAFALGMLGGAGVGGDALRLAGTGFVGAYTTFSTWMFESHRMAEEGELRAAAVNVAGPLALGLGAAALGRWVAGGL
jgi:CrcB protein